MTLRREDGRIICDAVTVADTTFRRMKGLLGRRSLDPDQGIVLRPAWSIHTAFMQFPIDVVFVDGELTVLRVEPGLKTFRTASCRGAREVIELAAGVCERRGLAAGDRIAWASRSLVNTSATESSPTLRSERRGTVLVASSDPRFVKLARFLLENRGIAVGDQTVPVSLSGSLEEADVDAVLLDARESVSDGLRAMNEARVQRPDVPIVLVAESPNTQQSLTSVHIYDKWGETDAAMDAVEEAVTGTS